MKIISPHYERLAHHLNSCSSPLALRLSPLHFLLYKQQSVHFNEEALQIGIRVCGGGETKSSKATKEEQYMCASGLYMSYYTALNHKGYFDDDNFDFVMTCAHYPFSASCYKWTFRFANPFQVEKMWEKDPCNAATDGVFSSNLQRRGCIWGFATNWYVPYDLAVHKKVLDEGGDVNSIHSLVDFCTPYLHTGSERQNWKSEWLTCIAGGVEYVAYDGIQNMTKVEVFCSQLLANYTGYTPAPGVANEGYRFCVDAGSSNSKTKDQFYGSEYLPRINQTIGTIKCKSDVRNCLHGWRTDLFEDEE